MVAMRMMGSDRDGIKAGGGRARGDRVVGRFRWIDGKGYRAHGWSIHCSCACGRRGWGGLCGGPMGLLVLNGAANIFIMTTSVERDGAAMIVRVVVVLLRSRQGTFA